MINRETAQIICPTLSGPKTEFLYGAYIFKQGKTKSIFNITIDGYEVIESPMIELVLYSIYLGDQTKADSLLVDNLWNWSDNHIGRDIPYIAIRIRYNDDIFVGPDYPIIEADIER